MILSHIFVSESAIILIKVYKKGNDPMFFNKCYNSISAEETKKIMSEDPEVMLLDVREKDEYSSGHINKSKNIPLSSLGYMKDKLPKNKEKPIITYCLSGARAKHACKALNDLGYNNIYCLGGLYDWPYGFVR